MCMCVCVCVCYGRSGVAGQQWAYLGTARWELVQPVERLVAGHLAVLIDHACYDAVVAVGFQATVARNVVSAVQPPMLRPLPLFFPDDDTTDETSAPAESGALILKPQLDACRPRTRARVLCGAVGVVVDVEKYLAIPLAAPALDAERPLSATPGRNVCRMMVAVVADRQYKQRGSRKKMDRKMG